MTNTPAPPNPYIIIEVISISVKSEDTNIEITNVYIPTVNIIGTHYHPYITHLNQDENRIILVNFNAHHESWCSLLPNDQRAYIPLQTHTALSSDHKPIMVNIEKHGDDRHTLINYNKVNREGFRAFIEENIELLLSPTCVRSGERQFRTIVQTAAKRFIPAGRIKNICCKPVSAAG